MEKKLNYQCPACDTRFNIDQARHSFDSIKLSASTSGIVVEIQKQLIHIVCPKCETIVSSVHMPS